MVLRSPEKTGDNIGPEKVAAIIRPTFWIWQCLFWVLIRNVLRLGRMEEEGLSFFMSLVKQRCFPPKPRPGSVGQIFETEYEYNEYTSLPRWAAEYVFQTPSQKHAKKICSSSIKCKFSTSLGLSILVRFCLSKTCPEDAIRWRSLGQDLHRRRVGHVPTHRQRWNSRSRLCLDVGWEKTTLIR